MKYQFLLVSCIVLGAARMDAQVNPLERFANTVLGFSSQYSSGNYSAMQATGAYNVWPSSCGSNILHWEPSTQNASREFLVLGFDDPQPANVIRVYQTWGAAAVDTLYLRNAANGNWQKVYEAAAVAVGGAGGCTNRDPIDIQLLEVKLPQPTAYNIDAMRIAVNSSIEGWQAIDAASLILAPSTPFEWSQYADSVLDFSSQYNATSYSAGQMLKKYDSWPLCASVSKKWAPETEDNAREFIELWFRFPAAINGFRIFQANSTATPNMGAGAVDTVYARNANTGEWQVIDSRTAVGVSCKEMMYEKMFATTSYPVDALRIAVNSALEGWQEFDAVAVFSAIPANARRTAKSGPWTDPATWEDGILPVATDDVYVGSYHTLQVNTNVSCRTLNTLKNAAVVVQPGKTVTVMN